MLRLRTLTAALLLGGFAAHTSLAQATAAQRADMAALTTITVEVTGIHSPNGEIMLYLLNAPDGFPTRSEKGLKGTTQAASKAVNGVVTATFAVVPGTYAVTTLHDENSNGKMDSNAFAFPKNGMVCRTIRSLTSTRRCFLRPGLRFPSPARRSRSQCTTETR